MTTDIATRSGLRSPASGGALAADRLIEPWLSCLHDRLGEIPIFDCHTHLGCADPDGSCFDADELLGALEIVGARVVVFPLAEPGSYRPANDRTLAAAQAASGRLSNVADLDRFRHFTTDFIDLRTVPDDLPPRESC
jgi:hypothetical protein